MQAPHTASVRNVSVIEIPLKDCVLIVMTDNQPAFCEVDHTSPGPCRAFARRFTTRSTGKLIATRSQNGIRLARIKATQPPPAQKASGSEKRDPALLAIVGFAGASSEWD